MQEFLQLRARCPVKSCKTSSKILHNNLLLPMQESHKILALHDNLAKFGHRFLSVVDVERLLLLEAVKAMFEPSSATKMLEVNEVNTVTEPVSSHRAPTMDVEGLPDSCCSCLRLLGHMHTL